MNRTRTGTGEGTRRARSPRGPGAWARRLGRGIVAGVAGTTVMTGTLALEQAVRRGAGGPADYDASDHVVTAAAAVLGYLPRTRRGRAALFQLVHWGYGSAVAAVYPALRLRMGRPVALPVFYAGCQTMAMTLFPTVGGTPPPWRWRRSVLVSSLVQHAVYAIVVDAAYRPPDDDRRS